MAAARAAAVEAAVDFSLFVLMLLLLFDGDIDLELFLLLSLLAFVEFKGRARERFLEERCVRVGLVDEEGVLDASDNIDAVSVLLILLLLPDTASLLIIPASDLTDAITALLLLSDIILSLVLVLFVLSSSPSKDIVFTTS